MDTAPTTTPTDRRPTRAQRIRRRPSPEVLAALILAAGTIVAALIG